MANDVTIDGLSALNDLLTQLPAQIEKKLMRGALRAGQKVVMAQAQGAVHSVSGALAASLKVTTRARAGKVSATVKAGNKAAYYAHMVEFGTAQHWIRPKGAKSLFFAGVSASAINHPGAKKKPFMRPALDAAAHTNSAAFQAVQQYLTGRITKELSKLPDETDDR